MEFDIFNDEERRVVCIRNDKDVLNGGAFAHLLTIGAVYTIESVQVDNWFTLVTLREFPGLEFNSVLFEEIGEEANWSENINGKKRLADMSQYHIDRDLFCKIVNKTVGYEKLNDAFSYAGEFAQDEEFAWWRHDDEFYILHKRSGMMVNWYKHFGRTNTCSQENRTVEDYYIFFTLLNEELDYWFKTHKIKR